MPEKTTNTWWGYKHISGTYQAKRFFEALDITEAKQSPFCAIVIDPFEAVDREEALEIIKRKADGLEE